MNSWITLHPWLQLGAVLAIEVSLVYGVAKLAVSRINSAPWQRALWQSAVVAMLVLFAGELSGARGLFINRPEQTHTEKQRIVSISTFDLPTQSEPASVAPSLEIVNPMPQRTIASRTESSSAWLVGIWLAGIALAFARMLLALAVTIAFRFSARPLSANVILERISRFAQMLRLRRSIDARESSRVAVPFTFGIVKPVLVVPQDFAITFTPEQQDSALLHELAHIAGFDSAWRCVGNVACALLWWHPLVWLARRELDRASELAADEASALIPNGPRRLAECLLECAKHADVPTATSWLGVIGFRSGLGQRVARLLHIENEPVCAVSRPRSWCLRFAAPLAFSTLLWMGLAARTSKIWRGDVGWHSSVLGTLVAAASPTVPTHEITTSNAIAPVNRDEEVARLETEQPVPDETSVVADPLITRSFKLGPNFLRQLAIMPKTATSPASTYRWTPPTLGWTQRGTRGPGRGFEYVTRTPHDGAAIRSLFKTVGVDLSDPDKTLFFCDTPTSLMVSATSADLDRIENAIAAIETNNVPMLGDVPHAGRFFRPATSTKPQTARDNADPRQASPSLVQNHSAREVIYWKLSNIRIAQFGPIDNLPLPEVLITLAGAARQSDPQKEGVNVLIDPTGQSVATSGAAKAAGTLPEPVDFNAVSIRIGNPLFDITVQQALDIIVKIADPKIKYSVEDYGVVISPKAPEAAPLHTRTFRLDTNTFWRALRSVKGFTFRETQNPGNGGVTADQPPAEPLKPGQVRPARQGKGIEDPATVIPAERVIPTIRSFFETLGVNLNDPGKAVFYSDRRGYLMVRATLQDLDTIEKALHAFEVGPQQLTLHVKAVEVPALRFGLTNAPAVTPPASQGFTNGPAPTLHGVLTPEQFQSTLSAMEKIGGTEVLSSPTVTTHSGRQAQIKVVDVKTVVTGFAPPTNNATAGSDPQPVVEQFEIGPVVDVVAYVSPDGYSIQMTVLPSLREFLGYADVEERIRDRRNDLPAAGGPLTPNSSRRQSLITPQPKFRLRQAAASARLIDGQTVVVGAGTATATNGVIKSLYFFITPRLIDAAGNPLHTDEELRARYNAVQPQEEFRRASPQ